MRPGILVIASIIVLAAAADARSQTTKAIGDWSLTESRDPMTDSRLVVAMVVADRVGLAVTCRDAKLSIGLAKLPSAADGKFIAGAFYAVNFRADRGKIIETRALAVSETRLDFDMTEEDAGAMARAARSASFVAVRISDALIARDYVFPARGGDRAFRAISGNCEI